jgi:hypothetical protein
MLILKHLKISRENQNSHFKFNIYFFFFNENHAVCEIIERKYGRARQTTDDNIIQIMLFAYWIPKPTDTHSEYFIPIAFHDNNSYANAPQCYVIRTLSVLL